MSSLAWLNLKRPGIGHRCSQILALKQGDQIRIGGEFVAICKARDNAITTVLGKNIRATVTVTVVVV